MIRAEGAALGGLLLCAAAAFAEEVHGRAELQGLFATESPHSVAAMLDARTRADALGDLRLSWRPGRGRWALDAQYQLSLDAGDTPHYARELAALGIAPDVQPPTLWNLTQTFADEPRFTATGRIDRLALGYTTEHLVLRAGRQALTWGAGLVFHPMDLLDPFAPDALDTEYKPGTDMVYAQYLFAAGSDLQLVAVPRSECTNHTPSSSASSYALQFHRAVGALQTTWMVARDYRDWVLGLGINGALGGATWNGEAVPTIVDEGTTAWSALLNISNATHFSGRDITLFFEYYRNGFGLPGSYAVSDLPSALRARLVRGQVFDTGRDYTAGGATLQWSPLLQISPTLIANLNDGSIYGIVQATRSLTENLNLILGAQWPVGSSGTEFGGIPLSAGGSVSLETPARLYIQLRQYF